MGKQNQKKQLDRSNRPDFSAYLSHFTKDGDFCHAEPDVVVEAFRKMTAFERLCSILEMKEIKTSTMPWTNSPGLCFTECPWSSLLIHTQQYSPYGLGFTKEFIYRHGGSPVFYIRFKMLNAIVANISDNKTKESVMQFLTPYSPEYDTDYAKKKYKRVDYTHEREWRMPNSLTFSYEDIAFVIIQKHVDYDMLPEDFKVNFDRNKIIVMDNYRLVEDLWPVHIK